MTEDQYKQLLSFRVRAFADKAVEIVDDASFDHFTFTERIGLCIEAEMTARSERKVARLNKLARFSAPNACIENIDYMPGRSLERETVSRLASGRFIDESRNVIVVSPTGAGKSYLVQAIGNAICRHGRSVRYIRHADLCKELTIAKHSSRIYDVMAHFIGVDLLIIDDLFLSECSTQHVTDLFEIIESRMTKGSLLLSSQLHPEQWHLRIDTKIIADALLDRIIHRAYMIKLEGPNMREHYAKKDVC